MGRIMKVLSSIVLSIVFLSVPAMATESLEFDWKKDCDKSQRSMNECARDQFKHYDTILNNVYNQQTKYLQTQKYVKQLQNAQRAWITFRDKDCTYVAGKFEDSGSIWALQHYSCLTERTKTRIVEIRSYLSCRENGCQW